MRFGLLALLLALMPLSAHPASSRDDAAQLQSMLTDLLGPGRARVFITHSVQPAAAPLAAAAETSDVLWDRWEKRVHDLPPVLPGYRIPRSLQNEARRTLAEQAEKARPRTATTRTITLILDPEVSAAQRKTAREIVTDITGLDPAARDVLQVVSAPFAVSRLRADRRAQAFRAKAVDCMLYAATAAVIILLVYLLFSPRGRKPLFDAHPHEPHYPDLRESLPCLSMLAPHHVKSAAKFLDGEPAPDAAYVLRTTEIGVATDIFVRFSSRQRRAVSQEILFSAPPEKAPPSSVEGKVLAVVAAHEAGEGLMEELLLRSPESIRREVLSHIHKREPARARRLEGRLVSLPDFAAAAPESLRTCLAAFSCEDIALSLFEAPDESRRAFLDALPETVRSMVSDQLKYSVPDSYEQVHQARAEIFSRWKRLETYGRVQPLRRGE